jgi:hypothetical protein
VEKEAKGEQGAAKMSQGMGVQGGGVPQWTTAGGSSDTRSTHRPGPMVNAAVSHARKWNTDIPKILPHERVFPVQIGNQLFRLSGASISSDGMCVFLFFFCVTEGKGMYMRNECETDEDD